MNWRLRSKKVSRDHELRDSADDRFTASSCASTTSKTDVAETPAARHTLEAANEFEPLGVEADCESATSRMRGRVGERGRARCIRGWAVR